MNRKATMVIAMQAILIILLFWFMVYFAKDEFETASTGGTEESINSTSLVSNNSTQDKGAATLLLSKASQQQSGIKTIALSSTQHQASTASFASVEGVDSLLEMRARYLTAMADSNVIRSSLASKQQNAQRMQLLNQDDKNVSDSAVQEAWASLHAEQARLSASQTLAKGIRDSMQQQWGSVLTDWATQANPKRDFLSLVHFQAVLIKVSLPFDVSPSPSSAMQISQIGGQPIAKASFEETPEMFLKAARHADLDTMRGVSANVMCGQEGYFGTSAFQVILDYDKITQLPASEFVMENSEEIIEAGFEGLLGTNDKCSVDKLTINNNVLEIKSIDLGKEDGYELEF